MTAPDLLAALGPLLDTLRGLGVRHFVGGSIASSAHGVARASIDADVVAELRPTHVDRLLSSLRGPYYVPEARVRDAAVRRASFNLIHLETMLKVDVFVSRDRPFDRRALERAQPAPSEMAGDGPLTLASAEDVVLAKLEWFRRGGEVSERQWTDVRGVLQASGASLDRQYMQDGARELGLTDLLARALVEAEER
ncbi:MAG TPA: hypothetical protein VLL75_18110 [Vicinamibacteria bacterium]|nr:hypothetical protein [Vicinamibacteria bacterium]